MSAVGNTHHSTHVGPHWSGDSILGAKLASPSNPEVSFLAGDLLPLVTVAAIAIGGIIAIFKFQLFRDSAPHLTITHTISHRLVGNSYLHIAVTAELHNSSKVKMELRQAIFRLQQVVPTSDEDVQGLYAKCFSSARWKTCSGLSRGG